MVRPRWTNAAGNVVATTNALGYVTQYARDSMNRLVKTTLPDARVATNSCDGLSRLTARTGAGSVPVFYRYDALSRMTNLIDGVSNVTRFAYDSMSRLTNKTYADGSFYRYSYNPRGWLTNRTDAANVPTLYAYNNVGQLTNVNYQTDADIQYFYDNLGRMTQRVDAAGTWVWTYDGSAPRVLTEHTPYSQTVTYTYAADTKELASVGLNSSNRTMYYWHQGRLTNVTAIMNGITNRFDYAYKPGSDLLETTTYLGGTATVTRLYDALDRLTNISAQCGSSAVNSFSYLLDSAGRRTKRTHLGGGYVDYAYDAMDQVTNAAMTDTSHPAFAAAYRCGYQYDMVGSRLHEDRGQQDLDGTFNVLNQLTHRDWSGKLDVYGTITSTNPPVTNWVGGVTSVLYTAVSPTQYWGGAFVNSPGSNSIAIVTVDGSGTNEQNKVVFMPPTKPQDFLWDANGNLTNDGLRAYFWNNENRLSAIETATAAVGMGIEKRRSEYVYDGMGRRVQSRDYSCWTGAAYATTNVTRFVWDGFLVLAVLNGDNCIRSYVVHGLDFSQSLQGAGGIGGILATVEQGTNHLYFADGNGNITDVTDAQGTVIAHYEYCPFARLLKSCGPFADSNSWLFSSQWYESVWRHYRYAYRIYVPDVGVFLSKDPIEEWGGVNLCGFVGNDPITFLDFLGLRPITLRQAVDLIADAMGRFRHLAKERVCAEICIEHLLAILIRESRLEVQAYEGMFSANPPARPTDLAAYAGPAGLGGVRRTAAWEIGRVVAERLRSSPGGTEFSYHPGSSRPSVGVEPYLRETSRRLIHRDRRGNPSYQWVNTGAAGARWDPQANVDMALLSLIDRVSARGNLQRGLAAYGTGPAYGQQILTAARFLHDAAGCQAGKCCGLDEIGRYADFFQNDPALHEQELNRIYDFARGQPGPRRIYHGRDPFWPPGYYPVGYTAYVPESGE